MSNKNSACLYFALDCQDETRKYDDSLCFGEGNFRNCGTYQKLIKIQTEVKQKTPERRNNIISILTESPLK